MSRGVSLKDWLYLIVSVAASYYLVQMERGQEQDIELRLYWFLVKCSRKLTDSGIRLEKYFNAQMNDALDRRSTC
jgi:hypothetical protein